MSKANRIDVYADNPQELARLLYDAARRNNLPTWRVEDARGETRYIHTTSTEQWEGKAWLVQSFPLEGIVRFQLRPPEGKQYDTDVRGVYLGRFVQMLVNRFGDAITRIVVDRE